MDNVIAINKEISEVYLGHVRDKRLEDLLRELTINAEACRQGSGSRRRSLFVIGDSGSGKTAALRHQFRLMPEFRPTTNEYGEIVKSVVSIDAPKPCTAKDLAVALFKAIGVPASMKMTEGQLYSSLKTQFRERGILYVHIDEAQHLVRQDRPQAIRDMQDRLKSLMQIEDWPLHMVFSGMPQMAELLNGDQQLANRAVVMRFIPLTMPGDRAVIDQVFSEVVSQTCGLKLEDDLRSADFIGRLCHANKGCFGEIIRMVKDVCLLVMGKGLDTVDRRAFVHIYQRNKGCLPSENIFTAARWREIDPDCPLADMAMAHR